jgi:hypothetical protein
MSTSRAAYAASSHTLTYADIFIEFGVKSGSKSRESATMMGKAIRIEHSRWLKDVELFSIRIAHIQKKLSTDTSEKKNR